MGICQKETSKRDQLCVSNRYISLDDSIKISKSICKITTRLNERYENGIGLFMRVFPNNTFRSLIAYKVISDKLIGKSIEIQIHK